MVSFTITWLHLADTLLILGIQSLQLLLGRLVVLLEPQRYETTIRNNKTPLWPWIMARNDSLLLFGLCQFSSALLLLAEFQWNPSYGGWNSDEPPMHLKNQP